MSSMVSEASGQASSSMWPAYTNRQARQIYCALAASLTKSLTCGHVMRSHVKAQPAWSSTDRTCALRQLMVSDKRSTGICNQAAIAHESAIHQYQSGSSHMIQLKCGLPGHLQLNRMAQQQRAPVTHCKPRRIRLLASQLACKADVHPRYVQCRQGSKAGQAVAHF